MSNIIGITGPIGSGKTTLTHILATFEPSHAMYESGEIVAELADDFNKALSGEIVFETTSNDIDLVNQALIWFVEAIGEKLHQKDVTWNQLAITKRQLVSHPQLFERLFIYIDLARKQPSILNTDITANNKTTYRPLLQWLGNYLVAKLRPTIWYDEIFRRIDLHDSDKNLILINGLVYPSEMMVVRNRGGTIIAISRPAAGNPDPTEATESARAGIKADSIIINNGSPKQLEAVATKLWEDMLVGKPRPIYEAVEIT